MLQTSQMGAKIFMVGRCYPNMATIQGLHAQSLYQINITKTSFNCNKACGSKLNVRIHIFYKSMALFKSYRSIQHHTKLVDPYFLFLHTFIVYKLFIKY